MPFVRWVGVAWSLWLGWLPIYDRASEMEAPSTAIQRGKTTYDARKCATCHQIAGHGNRRFPLDGVGGRLSEADLRRWLTDPGAMERAKPRQPAVRMSEWLETERRLRPDEIDALVAYLATLK